MSLVNDFKAEMAQSVTIELATGHDGWNKPTFGTGVAYAAHVKPKIKNIKDSNGNDAVSSYQIYLDVHPSVSYDSRITYGSDHPAILLIKRQWDEKGGAYSTIIYT
jgi:hypothetical protein